jgi:DNA-binding winged helix-turn-helix (wHTH) protein
LSEVDYHTLSLGGTVVQLDTRLISNQLRSERIEPKVALSLRLLADQRGKVVSREKLLRECWPGRTVGDDSVYRIIMKIRRLSAAYGGFEVETIPKCGFRLTVLPDNGIGNAAPDNVRHRTRLTRTRPLVAWIVGLVAVSSVMVLYGVNQVQPFGPARVVWDYNQGRQKDAPNGIRVWSRQSAETWVESFADGSARTTFELVSPYRMKLSGCKGVLLRRDKTLIAFVPRPACPQQKLLAEDIDAKTGMVTRPWFDLGPIQRNDWK